MKERVYRWLQTNQPATMQDIRKAMGEAGRDGGLARTPVERAVKDLLDERKIRCTSSKFYRSDMSRPHSRPRASRNKIDPRQTRWPWD